MDELNDDHTPFSYDAFFSALRFQSNISLTVMVKRLSRKISDAESGDVLETDDMINAVASLEDVVSDRTTSSINLSPIYNAVQRSHGDCILEEFRSKISETRKAHKPP